MLIPSYFSRTMSEALVALYQSEKGVVIGNDTDQIHARTAKALARRGLARVSARLTDEDNRILLITDDGIEKAKETQ